MARIVMKFGGTSVANMERIRSVAKLVKAEYDRGNEVAVVLSAMSGETNKLVALCREASPLHDLREYDTVVATGEQVTVGLLAIILQSMGVDARSWLGWQLGFKTDDAHGSAKILGIASEKIIAQMKEGRVAVCAGFQGVTDNERIATLGRGGSDTSAVAIAAALNADQCDIYTDVDGVYTTDPRICSKAKKVDKISYEEMLELASLGAKVLQTRSVSMAMRYNIKLQVLSSFDPKLGTFVVNEEEIMENNVVSGIAHSLDEARITINGVPDRPGIASEIFTLLGDSHVNVDMIVQSRTDQNKSTDMTFTVSRSDFLRAQDVLSKAQDELGFEGIESDDKVCKVSIVGIGMRSHAGVAQKMFATLAGKGINLQVISTSEIKISVLISEEYVELAVRTLHTAFGLDKPEDKKV